MEQVIGINAHGRVITSSRHPFQENGDKQQPLNLVDLGAHTRVSASCWGLGWSQLLPLQN